MDDISAHISTGPVAGRLENKVVLITGAGSGQGQAAALLFAAAGAKVFASDISDTGLANTIALAARDGSTIQTALVDASSESQVEEWVKASVHAYGGIDVLYNNGAGAHLAPFESMTLTQWHETLRLELDVVFIPTKAVWKHLIDRKGGSIINIASVSGMYASEYLGASAHAAGKGGVIAWTRQLALEGAKHWIRVNSISPGPIATPATFPIYNGDEDFRRVFDGWPLLSRTGRPIDVAYAGLFLASAESNFITGANIVVDGGTSSKLGLADRG